MGGSIDSKSDQKSEIQKYLSSFNMNDLELISKSRVGSNKKNFENGPVIYGQKSAWGKPSPGFSVPNDLKNNKEHEFGTSSYHNGAH